MSKRFFSDSSFWNQPVAADAVLHVDSAKFVQHIQHDTSFHINIDEWTIPVYYADATTPRYNLQEKLADCPISPGHLIASQPWFCPEHPMGIHETARNGVPIPDYAMPDGENDAHMSIVDVDAGRVYDMWQVRHNGDGSWSTNSAISYDLDGSGVYSAEDFPFLHNNESVHYHGPCRASGVPNIAGLIMHWEIEQGRIEHKLACATPFVGLQKFCSPPACWTDGWLPGGIPEGIVMQLDPELDLEQFNLSKAGMVVARALQEYGAVVVDYSCSSTLYAEGLFYKGCEKSWQGIMVESAMESVGFENFRFLKPEKEINKGSHPVFHSGLSRKFYDYHINNNLPAPRPVIER